MQKQRLPLWAAAALASGLALWVWMAIRFPPPAEPRTGLDRPPRPARRGLLAAALALAVFAWTRNAGGTFRAPGVVSWLSACACWFAAWWPGRAPEGREPAPRWAALAALAGILVVAIFFSFHRLAHTPSNPTSDHAETLLDVRDILQGERPIYFPRNTGREPIKFYWLWLLVSVVGLPARYLTLKIATASLGLLAIPAMYLLGREMGGDRLGLFASLLVAFGKWHFSMARIGLRVTYAVFPTAMTLWALLRYLRRGDRRSALWAGLWIGIGLATYVPFRVVPLLVGIGLVLALADPRRRGRRRDLLSAGLLIAVTAAFVSLPLLRYMVDRPDMFWYRAASRAASTEKPIGPHPAMTFASNVARMALALHWRGTGTAVNAVEGDPFLDPVSGALFLAGAVLAISLTLRGSARWALLGLGLFVLTLPSTLSLAFPDENPSINRSVTAIPVVFLIAALPLSEIARRAGGAGRAVRIGTTVSLGALLSVAAWQNFGRYFVDFDRQYPLMVQPALEVARVIETYRAQGVPLRNVYLLSIPNWVDARNVAFELGDPDWVDGHNIAPDDPPPLLTERPLLFLYKKDSFLRRSKIQELYRGEERVFPQPLESRDFSAYLVR